MSAADLPTVRDGVIEVADGRRAEGAMYETEAEAAARWAEAREGELAAIAELVRAEWPWPRVAPLLGVT